MDIIVLDSLMLDVMVLCLMVLSKGVCSPLQMLQSDVIICYEEKISTVD